ncbi:unnamed protein product [Rhodiola kirilowii]
MASSTSPMQELKKGPWKPEEDMILIEYVKKHGERDWNMVRKHSGLARCGKSCRLRWNNHLRPNLRKGPFSAEEEKLICELHSKIGNKWAQIATMLPGRTDNEIKNFWNTRIKRLARKGAPLYHADIGCPRQDLLNPYLQHLDLSPTTPTSHSLLFPPPPPSSSSQPQFCHYDDVLQNSMALYDAALENSRQQQQQEMIASFHRFKRHRSVPKLDDLCAASSPRGAPSVFSSRVFDILVAAGGRSVFMASSRQQPRTCTSPVAVATFLRLVSDRDANIPPPNPFSAMDLLSSAYTSDSDEGDGGGDGTSNVQPPYKKTNESVRMMESSSQAPEASQPLPVAAPTVSFTGSISDSNLPRDLSMALKHHKNGGSLSRLPERLSVSLNGHSNAVNTIMWSPTHSHLLASAGMDNTVCIWNAWSQDQKARVLNNHTAAETHVFEEDQVVGVVKFHPKNHNLFISGGSKGQLKLYDIRAGKVIHEYNRRLGPILDVEFINDAKQFVSSSDVSGSNISENSIIVWDVLRQVPLSNQVYVEAFTCPSIKSHPSDPNFIVQSNGNYIAIFSSTPPYRLDKYKRYEGHGVAGFPVKCSFSLNGDTIVSGSYDGPHLLL